MSSELASLIEANTRIDGAFPTPISGLHLSRYSSPTQPCQGVQCPILAIVAQGSKQIMLGNEALTYDSGHYLVVSLDLPVSGRVTTASKAKPFLGMRLDLDVKQIPSLRTSGKIQRATKPERGAFVSRMTPELLDPVLRLLRLLGKPEDSAVLAPLLHREILYRLWRSEQGEQLERMAQSDGSASGVAKAVIWLKENFDKPFSIKRIAMQTNMSPSGLHHHFKTLTNMTPFNIKSTFACRRLDGSCWSRRWMRLQRRITLVMRAAHSSPANTAVSLEPRHFGMWSRPAGDLCGAGFIH